MDLSDPPQLLWCVDVRQQGVVGADGDANSAVEPLDHWVFGHRSDAAGVDVGCGAGLQRHLPLQYERQNRFVFQEGGSVTAGNSSGINDGSCALIIASEKAAKEHGLTPKARILGLAAGGVPPRIMGIGPIPSTKKLMERLGIKMDNLDIIELNEAFAAQGLAVLRELDIADDDPRVNPQGGAIALGHPLGASGARLVTTAMYQLQRSTGKKALCTMCVGVGQGSSIIIEKV